jgi:hypothetical protein
MDHANIENIGQTSSSFSVGSVFGDQWSTQVAQYFVRHNMVLVAVANAVTITQVYLFHVTALLTLEQTPPPTTTSIDIIIIREIWPPWVVTRGVTQPEKVVSTSHYNCTSAICMWE